MTLFSLIERLEKAEGPDRLLDAAIECELRRWQAYALDLNDKVRSHWKPIGIKGEVIDDQGITRYHAPERTRSIDAALTLVPSTYEWDVGSGNQAYQEKPWCNVWPLEQPYPVDLEFYAEGATPAIAACVASLKATAALRARSAMTEEGS